MDERNIVSYSTQIKLPGQILRDAWINAKNNKTSIMLEKNLQETVMSHKADTLIEKSNILLKQSGFT